MSRLSLSFHEKNVLLGKGSNSCFCYAKFTHIDQINRYWRQKERETWQLNSNTYQFKLYPTMLCLHLCSLKCLIYDRFLPINDAVIMDFKNIQHDKLEVYLW